jgi:hypothetical protein
MNNVAPLQGMAENLAQHGRYGDSMLVHMNPIEVQGIASLSPTGRLTTNPVTGQQEAFLPFLAPLLGGALGLGAGGSALLSGALTTIASGGDLKKGILSGLTSFGLGKIMDAIPSVGEGVDPSVAANISEGVDPSVAANISEGVDPSLTIPSADAAATADIFDAVVDPADLPAAVPAEPQGLFGRGLFRDGKPDYSRIGELDFKEDIFPGVLMSGLGYSTQLEMDRQDALRRQAEELDAEGKSDLERTEGEAQRAIQQRIYDYGLPSRGILPRDPRFAPQGLAGGGLVSLNPSDYQDKRDGLARLMGEPVRMQVGGSLPDLGQYQGYDLKLSPAETQSAIRGTQAISAPQMQALTASGYRAGFDPELQYFRTPDRFGNDPFPEVFDPRNPNAPVLPTNAQLAQELAEAEASGAGAGTADSAALYDMSGYVSPDGAYSQFLGGTLGSGIAGVPTMGQNYLSDMPVLSSDNTLDYPSSSNEGIAALQGLDYSDYPKRSDFGPSDEGGHIEYQQAQQEWFRNRMPSARIDQPVMPYDSPYDFITDLRDFRGINPFNKGGLVKMQDMGQVPEMPIDPALEDPAMMQADPMQEGIASVDPVMEEAEDFVRRGGTGKGLDNDLENLEKMRLWVENIGGSDQDYVDLIRERNRIDAVYGTNLSINHPSLSDPVSAEGGPDYAGTDLLPSSQEMRGLIEQTTMAILGQASPEEADAIIQAFVEQFGAEAFQKFRDQVLTSVVPNAQTEGMVEGQGDGMSDEIMGMIGDQQQVAVSPGEYIVPADVVSGIGNGSSDAGASELDRMLADIRQARTGMTEQPPEIDPRGAMPA